VRAAPRDGVDKRGVPREQLYQVRLARHCVSGAGPLPRSAV
jgi:hypothetical protein